MIYCTGDTHGDWMRRLNKHVFYEQKQMTKNDTVIVCGDFGYWHDTKDERYNLDWLNDRNFTTVFVDGNHSNHDRLDVLPISQWHGGNVHFIRPSVIHLMRGQVYTIENKKFFAFGGARCHDIQDGILDPDAFASEREFEVVYKQWYRENRMFRVKGYSWWERELPSKEEMDEGIANLEKVGNRVDFMITHSPDTYCLRQLDTPPYSYETDVLTDYLFKVKESIEYGLHLFGHMHCNRNIVEYKSICLYEQIIRIA